MTTWTIGDTEWSDEDPPKLTFADNSEEELSKQEYELLRALLHANGRTLTRDELLDAASKDAPPKESLDRSVDQTIVQLRRKLRDRKQQGSWQYIVTRRGTGYALKGAVRSKSGASTNDQNQSTQPDLVKNINKILLRTYPAEYYGGFIAATRSMWLSGLNLRRLTLNSYEGVKLVDYVEKALLSSCRVKDLLIDPERLELCKYAAMQDWGNTQGAGYRDAVKATLEHFCGMFVRAAKQERTIDLEIRTIDFPITYGVDSFNVERNGGDEVREGRSIKIDLDETSRVWVRFYPFHDFVHEDQPILNLTPKEDYWCRFYIDQFVAQWNSPYSTPWRCDRRMSSKGK